MSDQEICSKRTVMRSLQTLSLLLTSMTLSRCLTFMMVIILEDDFRGVEKRLTRTMARALKKRVIFQSMAKKEARGLRIL